MYSNVKISGNKQYVHHTNILWRCFSEICQQLFKMQHTTTTRYHFQWHNHNKNAIILKVGLTHQTVTVFTLNTVKEIAIPYVKNITLRTKLKRTDSVFKLSLKYYNTFAEWTRKTSNLLEVSKIHKHNKL